MVLALDSGFLLFPGLDSGLLAAPGLDSKILGYWRLLGWIPKGKMHYFNEEFHIDWLDSLAILVGCNLAIRIGFLVWPSLLAFRSLIRAGLLAAGFSAPGSSWLDDGVLAAPGLDSGLLAAPCLDSALWRLMG